MSIQKSENEEIFNQYSKIIKKRAILPTLLTYDLHIHTPASKCYVKKSAQNNEDIYMMIVEKFIESSVNVIAITDHNTCEGYYKIKEIFDRFPNGKKNNKMIIPGVEITCLGIHFIALFDEKITSSVFKKFLLECGFEEEKYDEGVSADLVTPLALCNLIQKYEGIMIVAHCDSTKGLLSSYFQYSFENDSCIPSILGDSIPKILRHPVCKGIFLNSTNNRKRLQELLSTFKLKQMKLLKASDSHCIEDEEEYYKICNSGKPMGSRLTWIKVANVSYSSLVAALSNSSENVFCEAPPQEVKPVILGMSLFGSCVGESKTEKTWSQVVFANELTCIIGARGAGKTTVLEYAAAIFNSSGVEPLSVDDLSYQSQVFRQALENKHTPKISNSNSKRRILDRFDKSILFMSCNNTDFALSLIPDRTGVHKYGVYRIVPETCSIVPLRTDTAFKYETKFFSLSINDLKNGKQNVLYFNQREIERLAYNQIAFEDMIFSFCDLLSDDGFSALSVQIEAAKKSCEGVARKVRELRYKGFEQSSEYHSQISKLTEKFEDYINKCKEKESILVSTISIINKNKENQEIVRVTSKTSYNLGDIEKFLGDWFAIDSSDNEYISKLQKNDLNRTLLAFFKYATDIGDCLFFHLFLLDSDDLAKKVGISDEKSIKICTLFKKKDLTYDICRLPETHLSFEFNVKTGISSKQEFRQSDFLSYGQKAICILNLIINSSTEFHDNRPLLIDQPEDDLDNYYITTTLVKNFQKIKKNRQVIIATHNSNIVIGSEAEHILVLKSDGNNTKIKSSGTIIKDTVREDVVTVLEGGKSALDDRIQKYQLHTSTSKKAKN